MDLQILVKMLEEENHRIHTLMDEYKGKCFRHGVLFKSGMGFDSCPACYFEGIANKQAAQQSFATDGLESEPKCLCHSEGVSPSCPVHGNHRR